MGGPDVSYQEVTLFLGNLMKHLRRGDLMACMDSMQLQPFYNFVYVPLCLDTGMNKGYGFVNFTKAEAADKFMDMVSQQQSQQCPLAALTVTVSKTQGLEANLARWCRPRSLRIRNPAAMPFVKGNLDSNPICIEHHQHEWSQRQEHVQSGEQSRTFQVGRMYGKVYNQKMQEKFGSSTDVGAIPGQPPSQCPLSRMDAIDDLMLLKFLAKRSVLEGTSIERQPGDSNSLSSYIHEERYGNTAPPMAPRATQKLPCHYAASDKACCTNEAIWSVPTGEELPLRFLPTEDTLQSVAPTLDSLPPWRTTTVDSLPPACNVGLTMEQLSAPAASRPAVRSGRALGMFCSF